MADVVGFEQEFVTRIKVAVDEFAGSEFVESFSEIDGSVHGWSGAGVMALLNVTVGFLAEGEEYLEIGTFCGKSLAGAMRDNQVRAQVIDNFWDGQHVENAWNSTVDRYELRDRITFHRAYTEQWEGDLPPIGVYFYDGNHDAGHTYEGLKKFEPYLADNAIVIADDYMIAAGHQTPFPGHIPNPTPVKTDVDRLLQEDPRYRLLGITPWGQQQAVMVFNR